MWFIGGNLQVYFVRDELDPYLVSFIKLVVHITVNSYIGVPLMFSQFGEWVHLPRPVQQKGILVILDEGLPNRWVRIAVVAGYILINVLAGFLKSL